MSPRNFAHGRARFPTRSGNGLSQPWRTHVILKVIVILIRTQRSGSAHVIDFLTRSGNGLSQQWRAQVILKAIPIVIFMAILTVILIAVILM